ncbi:MAG: hypothetical protein IH996_01995 [Proteobacteria bacterium]|nr:hypothetical protein [Pseudomonadota bacterium]
MDGFQLGQADAIPAEALGGLSGEAGDEVRRALMENPEIVEGLVVHRLVRISEVLDEVLGPLTSPLRLAPRDVKSLSNQLRIYLRIDPFEEFDEAKLAAAYLLADRLDPIWLDQHMGLPVQTAASRNGRINRATAETQEAIENMIDVDEVKRLGLCRWRASA